MTGRILRACAVALAVLAGGVAAAAGPEVQPDAATGEALVQGHCNTCHGTDYIVMNSPFLDEAKWAAVVDKMVKVFGAPIDAENQKVIVRYLAGRYGVAPPPP